MEVEALPSQIVTDKRASKIDCIQVLRGIAALIVAVFHLKELAKNDAPFNQFLAFFFNNGPAGVNLFFVISGFIMVLVTPRISYSGRSIYNFLVKRFVRIWPTYLIITLLYTFTGLDFHNQLEKIINSLLFIPLTTNNPPFFGYPALSVGWSLNYEIYFYLVLAISMLFSKYRWAIFFLIIFLTLVCIPSYYGQFTFEAEKEYNYGNRYINLATNPIIWNFVYGVIIGKLYINKLTFNFLSDFFSNSWIFYSVMTFAIWQYLSGFFGGAGPFDWGAGSSSLFLAVVFYNSKKSRIHPLWLIQLGDMSFSIYLLHLPTYRIIDRIFIKLHYPVYSTGMAAFLLSICLTIILSSLSYKYLELRLSNFLKNLIIISK